MSTEEKPLVNRVKKSPLITLKLEEYSPDFPIEEIDLKPFLFKGLILKEKEFRSEVKSFDWGEKTGHVICVYCSTDAIIPVWAYMLVASEASREGKQVFWGTKEEYLRHYYREQLAAIDWSKYKDQLIVLKGCSDHPVPASAYMEATAHLQPVARSIMYGEACSTVPIFKKKKSRNR